MKAARRTVAMVLVWAMALSLYVVTPAKAAGAGETFMGCTITVSAPYLAYYPWLESAESNTVELFHDEEVDDLADDFGIGLPTDLSDAPDSGKENFTAARALAKLIRNYIISTKEVTKEEANKLMPNYIRCEVGGQYGFSLNGLSTDGERWNIGAYQDLSVEGAIFQDGYWATYVNGTYADTNLRDLSLGTENYGTDIEIKWIPLNGGDYAVMTFDNDAMALEGKSLNGYVNKKVFNDENLNPLPEPEYKPVEGARVEIIDKDTLDIAAELKTDPEGKFTVSGLKEGFYKAVAYDETTDDAGRTYSRITRTLENFEIQKKPTKPTKVKATVKKSKAKKKTITVSWNQIRDYDAQYQVYVSKKKNSGYKKAAEVRFENKVTFKRTKGTYYVKVRNAHLYERGEDEDYHVVGFYSAFSKPVKVKVK